MSEQLATPGPVVVIADERNEHGPGDVVLDLDRWWRLAHGVLDAEGAVGELTLTFVDDADIAELNREHMGVDGPTDVLSFPMDDDRHPGVPALLGDVVIAPAVAARQYVDHAGTLDDELALLIVHGILHVLGHDHADDIEAQVMRDRERELLEAAHWGAPAPDGFRQTHA